MSELIEAIFKTHDHVFVGFSGGKDSTALAELCEPWRDQVTLISVDTGATFPHMRDRIEQYGERFRLRWLHSDQATIWRDQGLPSRLVPTANVDMSGRGVHNAPLMQAWQACCYALISAPMNEFLRAQPGAVFLHGQRLSEIAPGYYPSPGMFEQGSDRYGYKIYAPLKDWTEADVLTFLQERGIGLPIQYQYAKGDFSLDCWNCPAMLQSRRIAFMADHYPDKLSIAADNLRKTHHAGAVEAYNIGEMLVLAEKPVL